MVGSEGNRHTETSIISQRAESSTGQIYCDEQIVIKNFRDSQPHIIIKILTLCVLFVIMFMVTFLKLCSK